MKEKTISSLSQFIETIEKLKSYYPVDLLVNNPVANPFLYRGLSNKEYELRPSLFREICDNIDGQTITNSKYLAWTTEKKLLQAFIHEASGILNIPTSNLFEWAEYAQHYGVPTRFLDWSRNPLVALYFACKDSSDKEGSVWMMHGTNYKRFLTQQCPKQFDKTVKEIISDLLNEGKGMEYPILYTPYYVDARMSAQQSYFLVWGEKTVSLEDMLSEDDLFMNLPEKDEGIRVFGTAQTKDILFRFIIPADEKQPLIHELDDVGINEKTLFPGLDGIGRYIERKYRFDYKEMVSHPFL